MRLVRTGTVALPITLAPCLAAALLLAGAVPCALTAQGVGTVSGTVSDTEGSPLAGVEIRIGGTELRAATDERGIFMLGSVPAGEAVVLARRLGFRSDSQRVRVAPGATTVAEFRLRPLAPVLSLVVVRAKQAYTGRLAEYYERLESGRGGYIVTRDRIDAGNPRALGDVLRTVPGVDVVRGRVRMRGQSCSPLVWLDGNAMPAAEVDLNTFPPSTIEGIELYPSVTETPFRYQAGRDARCGTILLWSRGPESIAVDAVPMAVAELVRQHDDSTLFVASEVDVAAHPRSAGELVVRYPAELFAKRLAGTVLAEFVVGGDGKAEPGTIAIVSSPHPLFARAVREALRAARFEPATRGGMTVRQLLQMRFTFQR